MATELSPAEQYLADIDHEWGQYVAVAPIYHGSVLAANVGDPVPASNVADHDYLTRGLVAKVTTKAGQKAVTEAAVPAAVTTKGA